MIFLNRDNFWYDSPLKTVRNARLIKFDFDENSNDLCLNYLEMSPQEIVKFKRRNPNLHIQAVPRVIDLKKKQTSTEEWLHGFLDSHKLKDTQKLSYERDQSIRSEQHELHLSELHFHQLQKEWNKRRDNDRVTLRKPLTIAARGVSSAWSYVRSRLTTTTTPESVPEVQVVTSSNNDEIAEV